MDDPLVASWVIGLIIAGVIVVIAAALLLGIFAAARRILRLAGEALQTVERIKRNTHSIWSLDQTNQVAGGILHRAESIAEHGAAIVGTLHPSEDESNVA